MATVLLTEGAGKTEFLLSESSSSRSNAVLQGDSPPMQAGTVMGRITSSNKWVPFNPDGTDGSEVAAGMLLTPTMWIPQDQDIAIIDCDAEVKDSLLSWLYHANESQKAKGRTDLARVGITTRA